MLLIASIFLILSSCKKNEDDKTIMDADGNIYTSVTIGTQVWLVENLKTRYGAKAEETKVLNAEEIRQLREQLL